MAAFQAWAAEVVELPPRGDVCHLVLVRHGETQWNAEGRMQGQLDIALNDVGRQQARNVAKYLVHCGLADHIGAVVSSDLSRAKETADLIAEVCPNPTRRMDSRLREVNTGDLQGLLVKDEAVQKQAHAVKGAWDNGDFTCAYPGGESAEVAMRRGLQGLEDATRLGPIVLVVAHGGIMRLSAIGIELRGLAPSATSMSYPSVVKVRQRPVTNCCCSVLRYSLSTRTFEPRMWFENTEKALDDTG
mmetsp:Transcript_24825/g.54461  ORF Transcript_24825/g.54461 Transcript_24825/m.54461 type:complete len:245 (+) Transcript_24825:118-852(+)